MSDIKVLNVESIFPKPVAFYKFERDFTKEELSFFDILSKDLTPNESNRNTKNNYILESPELSGLKENILFCLKNYLYNVVSAEPGRLQPYITQSWLNFTEKGQYHQTHYHPNSFISGTLYIQVSEGDTVTFMKGEKNIIGIEKPVVRNKFNSDAWKFPVKQNHILLFPGSIDHMVEVKKTEGTRISLAFNSFVKGTLGVGEALSECKL